LLFVWMLLHRIAKRPHRPAGNSQRLDDAAGPNKIRSLILTIYSEKHRAIATTTLSHFACHTS
jgi:hypothetical protein